MTTRHENTELANARHSLTIRFETKAARPALKQLATALANLALLDQEWNPSNILPDISKRFNVCYYLGTMVLHSFKILIRAPESQLRLGSDAVDDFGLHPRSSLFSPLVRLVGALSGH